MATLQLPVDTWKIRNLLFEMPVPFSMRADVFEKYWPLVDNIWSRYDEMNVMGRGIDYRIPYDAIRLVCRLARKLENEPSREKPQSKRQRREGGTCSCRVKAKYFHGINGMPDHYRFEHSSTREADWVHSHTIDDSDGIKINSYLRAAAAIEAAKGYMPAEVYKNLRSVQLLDEDGNSLGDALDAAGGKFMTRQHANNAKQSALSLSGTMFLSKKQDPDPKQPSKKSDAEDRVAQLADILSVDLKTVWPETLGRTSDDMDEHAKNIKIDIRTLVESIAIGGRTEIPRHILMPLLSSMAEYMDKTTEDIDGKPLLEGILKIQAKAAAGVGKRANTPARTKSAKPAGTPKEDFRWVPPTSGGYP
ncbi:hypothetical protein N431DRAFT_457585 [Stipitochalara longipes BDJ]|nr:hypothetical protein N431DRAFT_457585 [Stipitochalara longipes BDJ]